MCHQCHPAPLPQQPHFRFKTLKTLDGPGVRFPVSVTFQREACICSHPGPAAAGCPFLYLNATISTLTATHPPAKAPHVRMAPDTLLGRPQQAEPSPVGGGPRRGDPSPGARLPFWKALVLTWTTVRVAPVSCPFTFPSFFLLLHSIPCSTTQGRGRKDVTSGAGSCGQQPGRAGCCPSQTAGPFLGGLSLGFQGLPLLGHQHDSAHPQT